MEVAGAILRQLFFGDLLYVSKRIKSKRDFAGNHSDNTIFFNKQCVVADESDRKSVV